MCERERKKERLPEKGERKRLLEEGEKEILLTKGERGRMKAYFQHLNKDIHFREQ